MSNEDVDIAKAFAEGTVIDKAVQAGVREALKRHKQAGNPVADCHGDQVVWISPEDLDVPADPDEDQHKT